MSTFDAQPRLEAPRSGWLLIPPPPLFVLAFVAGLQLQHRVALPFASSSLRAVPSAAGIGLIALAALLLAPAPVLFLRHRTTIIPHGEARSLVTAGPYRITRNPMYLGLTLAYLGVALSMNVVWPFLFLVLPLWFLQNKVIPFEEANLARIFGEEYRAYQQRVRRWI